MSDAAIFERDTKLRRDALLMASRHLREAAVAYVHAATERARRETALENAALAFSASKASWANAEAQRVAEKMKRAKGGVSALAKAIEDVERDHPLPRCRHGNALRDGAGERLEPTCGCRAKGGAP